MGLGDVGGEGGKSKKVKIDWASILRGSGESRLGEGKRGMGAETGSVKEEKKK